MKILRTSWSEPEPVSLKTSWTLSSSTPPKYYLNELFCWWFSIKRGFIIQFRIRRGQYFTVGSKWAGLSCSLSCTDEDQAVFLRFLEKWLIHIDALITPRWKMVILNTESSFLRSVLAQRVYRTGPSLSEQQQRKQPSSEKPNRLTSLPSQGPTEHPCAGWKLVSMLAVFKVSWLANPT